MVKQKIVCLACHGDNPAECPSCDEDGYMTIGWIEEFEVLADIVDKCNDILDKCKDILDKCNDILEAIS